MKKTITLILTFGLLFSSSPAFSGVEEGLGQCIFKVTVDVARDLNARINDKKVFEYAKKYPKHYSKTDMYYAAVGLSLGMLISGVGIPLIPVVIPVAIAAMGIKNGFSSVKTFFRNMGSKVSNGVKNHFAEKRRNKKLVANSELLLLLIDVQRGYGESLDEFARSVGVSQDRVKRKIKMFNVTGRLCKGANYTVKQIKQKAFKR
jgi:hypothetical protein